MSKNQVPRAAAIAVAKEICDAFNPVCEKLIVAGSLRRRKEEVGDVEILYVPFTASRQKSDDMFATELYRPIDVIIASMEKRGILSRRLNVNGRQSFGERNKLMLHRSSGIPVDLFSATASSWWNYLVCRTGPAELNVMIAEKAKVKGATWNPYGDGFTLKDGSTLRMESESQVFEFVGMRHHDPWERTGFTTAPRGTLAASPKD